MCTNGDPAPANSGTMNTAIENCASCNGGYALLSVSMDVESFRECSLDADNDDIPDMTDVDVDGDGLIEIRTLNDLATIRDDLDGDGVDDDSSKMRTLGDTGCGGLNSIDSCTGYELIQDLDFADNASYVGSEMNMSWRPTNSGALVSAGSATNAGWIPIGSSGNGFSSIFQGNGFTISNLYVRRSGRIGFFGETSSFAKIRNIGLVDGAVFCGSGNDHVGGLVGYNNGSIIASYATGNVAGGGGNDSVGGLVGRNAGRIIASYYATGDAVGGNGNDDVGGLVGYNNGGGSITASYATGNADGDNERGSVGGLVGTTLGSIIACYATGNFSGVGRGSGGTLRGKDGTNNAIMDSRGYSVTAAKGLTSTSFGTTWDFVWDFGDGTQSPALRYADYDGTTTSDPNDIDYCGEIFPVNVVCGTTLLPGQGR